jgi:hypothetical protein
MINLLSNRLTYFMRPQHPLVVRVYQPQRRPKCENSSIQLALILNKESSTDLRATWDFSQEFDKTFPNYRDRQ